MAKNWEILFWITTHCCCLNDFSYKRIIIRFTINSIN
jgi:hypothetical protein